jgi:hypothetical protein
MYNEIEDRIAGAALAGAVIAGSVAIAVFMLTGEVALNAATSTLDLFFAPPSLGLGVLLAAGLFKLAGRWPSRARS